LRYPLAPDQLALSLYQQRLELDEKLRNYPSYASISVDDLLAKRLRDAIAGLADDPELEELICSQLTNRIPLGNRPRSNRHILVMSSDPRLPS
jgi:hypothetical protein